MLGWEAPLNADGCLGRHVAVGVFLSWALASCYLRPDVIHELQTSPQAPSALGLPVPPVSSSLSNGEGRFS